MASCLEKHMLRHTDSYFILSQNGAQRVHTLCCCQHRTWIRCNATFLVQHLQNPMDEVNQQMRSNPIYASLMTSLTEFSRVVIACEKLNTCSNVAITSGRQRQIKWVRDCNKSTLLLRISDPLCRCTAIICSKEYMAGCCTYWKDWWG